LSEDMEKYDTAIEVAVRKIERQYADLATGGRNGREALLIDGVPVERYLPSFVWEHAKFPHRRALPELVSTLRVTVGGIEDELKHLATTYAEKTQKLQAAGRSGGKGKGATTTTVVGASTAPLEEVLPPDAVKGKSFLDTEYLVTCVVVVPSKLDAKWLEAYTSIASDCVTTETPACSPAVPGSSVKLFSEGETSIFSVTLLKGRQNSGSYVDGTDQWQPGSFVDFVKVYTMAAKDKGFIVRPYAYDAEAVAKSAKDKEELTKECARLHSAILRWCKAHFAEAFVAWMHLKVIRAFVESVLRYGLPVDFVTAVVVPAKARETTLQTSLDKMFSHLKNQALGGPLDDTEKKDTTAADYHPYVLQKATATSI